MKLPKQFIEEISPFETIYCLVSGGYHSTASALLLKDYGFKNVILLHNKTFLERKSAIQTMKKLERITEYEYIETIPDLKGERVWDILKRSFQKIPEVIEDIENPEKKYDRTKFECCNKLKKNSGKKFYKKCGYRRDQIVIISSLCPFESDQRSRRLKELRDLNSYTRYHKKSGGFYHIYPFRDFFSEKPFLPYLREKGFKNIKHYGCSICPILIVFKMYKEDRYYYSSKAAIRAGLPCFQKTIQDYLEV